MNGAPPDTRRRAAGRVDRRTIVRDDFRKRDRILRGDVVRAAAGPSHRQALNHRTMGHLPAGHRAGGAGRLPRLRRLPGLGAADRPSIALARLPNARDRLRLGLRGDQLRRSLRLGARRSARSGGLPGARRAGRDPAADDGRDRPGWLVHPRRQRRRANRPNRGPGSRPWLQQERHARLRGGPARRLQPGAVRLPQPWPERRSADDRRRPRAAR